MAFLALPDAVLVPRFATAYVLVDHQPMPVLGLADDDVRQAVTVHVGDREAVQAVVAAGAHLVTPPLAADRINGRFKPEDMTICILGIGGDHVEPAIAVDVGRLEHLALIDRDADRTAYPLAGAAAGVSPPIHLWHFHAADEREIEMAVAIEVADPNALLLVPFAGGNARMGQLPASGFSGMRSRTCLRRRRGACQAVCCPVRFAPV